MKATIKIFTDAKHEKSACSILRKVRDVIDLETTSGKCESYHKGGFMCSFDLHVPVSNWSEAPFSLLGISQDIGREWQLSGTIEEEFDAWSNDSKISGVESIHILCLRDT